MVDPLGDWSYTWPFLAAALLGYLLGSIPFGLVLTRLAGKGDIRQIGSGNIGATNVLRTGSKPLAAATLVLDGGKGAAAALIGQAVAGPDIAILAAGGAFLGHLFPVWLRFRGGKGVATFLGVVLALAFPVGAACCLTWLVVAALFRFSSLAALASALAAPVFAWFWASPQLVELTAALAVLVFVRHHANIRRLLAGEEPKIGAGKKPQESDGGA